MSDLDDNDHIPRKRRRIDRNVESLLNIILEHNQEKDDRVEEYRDLHNFDNNEEIAGKIKSIKLQNFMCHSNLEFNFEDKVNFISGKNGSGKSALLTALVIGLGGRAKETNRGLSLKNLIQNGKYKATIEITLNNKGFFSFKPHIYGNTIKVVRSITSNSSSYKIISEKGEVVSTKREDIDLINLYFNIQVNNPVTVLNQDNARTFLKTDAPKDFYNTFTKGTYLNEIEQTYLSLKNDKLPFLEKIITTKNNELIEGFKDVKEYKEKLKKMDELHEFEKEAKAIQDELYWAYALKFKKKLGEQKNVEHECLKRIPQIKERVENRDKIESELNGKRSSFEGQLNEIKEKKRVVENKTIEAEGSLASIKDQIVKKTVEIKRVKGKIDAESKKCDEIKIEIDNHESKFEQVEAKKRKIADQKQELEKRLSELKAVLSTTGVHKQQLSDTVEKLNNTVNQKEQYYNNLKQKLRYKEEYLKELKAEKNQLVVYSKWMPALVASIEEAFKNNQFKHKPLGPIGSYITVKEKSWGPAIEHIIGKRTLSSFCVDKNSNDPKVLKSIMDRLQIPAKEKPLISISKFINKVHDVSHNQTGHDNFHSLLNSITVTNPIIANFLIDQVEPENVLLVPTSDDAYRLMEDQRNVPANCKRAITKSGDLFFPAPNYRSYSGSVAETRYLQVSPEQAIRLAESEIIKIKEEFLQAKQSLDDAKKNLDLSRRQLEESNAEVLNLNRQVKNCENKLDELGVTEIPESYDLNLLKSDFDYRQNAIKICENTLKEIEQQKETLKERYQEINRNIDEIKKEKEAIIIEIQKVEEELQKINDEHCQITLNKDHYKNQLKTEESKLESVRKILKELEKDFKKAESEAREAHPEQITDTREIVVLEEELSKLNGIIKSMEKMIGNTENVPSAYEDRLKQFSDGISEITKVEEVKQQLYRSIKKIKESNQRIKEVVSANTKHSFLRMLQKKNYQGDLVIDHDKKTLSIIIKVDSLAKDGSSTGSLSGGERSYSMVSFIMSLWNNIYSPFFFLDEFDIFMDEINRNMVLNMLVTYAKSRTDQQFVFLTPRGHLSHDLLQDVHFFRMKDPRQNVISED